jgi:prephenate dehydrogenase
VDRIGVVGYGGFGRALTALAVEAGLAVRAWDPATEVPERHRAAGQAEVVEGADIVVVATPIDAIGPAVSALRPLLGPAQLVIDVGSVKQQPAAVMNEILGFDHPWAATHPLFGPTNIARGDRDLRAVVCPTPRHPGAAETASRFYERIGCSVVLQEPEEHDRIMARTHAIAFFVAKGLLDIGADRELPFAPPSFQALARTIETVRSDAAHLFVAIERANPYAAEARQELVDALSRVHAELERAALEPGPGLVLQAAEATPPALRETRDLIDELDRDIVRLLARRARLGSRAGTIKAGLGAPVRDPSREREVVSRRRAWAAEDGADEEAVADVFAAILRMSRRAQET